MDEIGSFEHDLALMLRGGDKDVVTRDSTRRLYQKGLPRMSYFREKT